MNFLKNLFGTKASEARTVSSFNVAGRAVNSTHDYPTFSKQGYSRNPVVFSCITKISQACAGIDLKVYKKRKGGKRVEINDSPLSTLLDRPNPMQSRESFTEAAISYYLIKGYTYLESFLLKNVPAELWTWQPDKI
jgi:HK97 family phage portal protein